MSFYGATHTNTAAENTDVVITLAAISSDGSNSTNAAKRSVKLIAWSHDRDPAAATRITIESPANTVLFDIDVTKGGPGFLPFDGSGFAGASGQAVVVRMNLSATSNTIGTLNVIEGNT